MCSNALYRTLIEDEAVFNKDDFVEQEKHLWRWLVNSAQYRDLCVYRDIFYQLDAIKSSVGVETWGRLVKEQQLVEII